MQENVPSYQVRADDLLDLHVFALLEHKRRAHDTLPHILDVLDDGLEVRGGVVGLGDEDVVRFASGRRGIQGGDGDKPKGWLEESTTHTLHWVDLLVVDRAKELKARGDFQLWLVSLDDSADNRDVDILSTDIVRR